MSAPRQLAVSLTAASTAAGDSAEQTATSIRAGVLRIQEDPRYLALAAEGGESEPARTARVPGIDPEVDGAARLFALLEPVLADLFERAPHLRRDAHKAALFVALPARDAVTDTWSLDGFVPELARRLDLRFAAVSAGRAGHAGVFPLIAEARAWITRGDAELAIVAGVDSLVGAARLRLFDEAERLRSPRSPDGFFPGEGAAAVVVESDRRIEARGEHAALALLGEGSGSEPETVRSDRPSTGRGLADAIRGALSDVPPPPWIISDFNGESYRGYEWGLVYTRLGERLSAIELTSHPARSTGDIGAASGAVQIALAAAGFRRGWAPAGEAIAFTGSDGPERAAVRLGRA